MKNLMKISEVAAEIAKNSTGQCCERQAWNYVNRNPRLVKRVKRGHFTFFQRNGVKKLCLAINEGKAAR